MGIGRREFLKFVATALGGLAIEPGREIAVNGDYYVNTRLGLGFVKPGGWTLDVFRDFAAKHEGQVVQNLPAGVDEEEFRRDQAATMVATISKYGDAVRAFGPSITVFKNREDYPSSMPGSLEALARGGIEGWGNLLREYEVLEAPSRGEVSRCACVRFKARWLFEHRDIEPVVVEDETLLIDQGSLLYTIHLYDSPEAGETAPEEFARFLEGLHLA
ncbi:hypothetical protein AB1L88_12500 [Tautonia sp. JC769]|uniref:hypothetical protein n=1 Tax=Tautonia sp. JC769 TaxID=3232135 RepID=UPI00345B0903